MNERTERERPEWVDDLIAVLNREAKGYPAESAERRHILSYIGRLNALTDASAEGEREAPMWEPDAGERTLRMLLWLTHGCSATALYSDDGELSCGACGIDFLSWPPADIERRIFERAAVPRPSDPEPKGDDHE